jgi:hypothetical protein
MLKATGAMAGMAALAAGSSAEDRPAKASLKFSNADFYGPDGTFLVDKAKQAVVSLCAYHGFPTFPGFCDNLWIADYGIGRYAELGLAAYMYINNTEDKYMLMDIFLLPNQMLPEHWHVAGEGNEAKREGWLVRCGLSHIVGIGEPNLGKDVVVPKCHWGGKVTTEHEVAATPGVFVPLAKVEARHWQLAGPEGAIITEVATVHTNSAVRHTDPVLNEAFLASVTAAK